MNIFKAKTLNNMFWTTNRKKIVLSSLVVPVLMIASEFINEELLEEKVFEKLGILCLLISVVYMYIIAPYFAIKYGSSFKIRKVTSNDNLKKGAYLAFGKNLYKKQQLKNIGFKLVVMIFPAFCFGGIFSSLSSEHWNSLSSFILTISSWYLLYHFFCFKNDHPLSILKAFSFTKWEPGNATTSDFMDTSSGPYPFPGTNGKYAEYYGCKTNRYI